MEKNCTQAAQKPLILKCWVYNKNGKRIGELIKDSFLEFYFTKKPIANR